MADEIQTPDASVTETVTEATEIESAPSLESGDDDVAKALAAIPDDEAPEVQEEAKEPEAEVKAEAEEDVTVAKARSMVATATKKLAKAQEIAKANTALTSRVSELEGAFKSLLTAPAATLRALGSNVDEFLAAMQAELGNAPTPKEADPEVIALRRRLDDQEAASAKAADDRAFEARKAEIVTAIKADSQFRRVNASNSHDLVIDTQMEYFAAHKVALPFEKAAAKVEAYLASLVGEQVTPQPAKKPATSNAPKATSRQASPTLTNSNNRPTPPIIDGDTLPMEEEARFQAVLRQLQ